MDLHSFEDSLLHLTLQACCFSVFIKFIFNGHDIGANNLSQYLYTFQMVFWPTGGGDLVLCGTPLEQKGRK